MLEPKENTGAADSHLQSFVIRYDYPVYFTRDLFDPENPCLIQALGRVEPDKRQRVAVFVDEGVSFAIPDLLPHIAHYAQHHRDHIEIAGDVVIVPGGEAVKN